MTQFKDFSITSTLYQGANTHVYRAVNTDNHQPVILKTTATAHPSPHETARYSHEYNALKTFKSNGLEGVVKVMDLIMHDHRPYLVLEDSGGADLKTLQKSGALKVDQLLEIAVKTASALGEIYQAHIIHKDIKPSNILYNPETGVLKLMDFSSASIISRETPTVESSMLMTATLPYMSPEQTGPHEPPGGLADGFLFLWCNALRTLHRPTPFPGNRTHRSGACPSGVDA